MEVEADEAGDAAAHALLDAAKALHGCALDDLDQQLEYIAGVAAGATQITSAPTDEAGRTALHFMCSIGATALCARAVKRREIVCAVARTQPDALCVRCKAHERTPIHELVDGWLVNGSSARENQDAVCDGKSEMAEARVLAEILRQLLTLRPEAVLLTDRAGCTLLSEANPSTVPAEEVGTKINVDALVGRNRIDGTKAFGMRDQFGCLPLHCLASNRSVCAALVSTVLSVSPPASPSSSFESLDPRAAAAAAVAATADQAGRLPLHRLCRNPCADFDAVKILLQAFPKAVCLPDAERLLPVQGLLQVAGAGGSAGDKDYQRLVRLLLEAGNDGSSISTMNTPLHADVDHGREAVLQDIAVALDADSCDGAATCMAPLSATESTESNTVVGLYRNRYMITHSNARPAYCCAANLDGNGDMQHGSCMFVDFAMDVLNGDAPVVLRFFADVADRDFEADLIEKMALIEIETRSSFSAAASDEHVHAVLQALRVVEVFSDERRGTVSSTRAAQDDDGSYTKTESNDWAFNTLIERALQSDSAVAHLMVDAAKQLRRSGRRADAARAQLRNAAVRLAEVAKERDSALSRAKAITQQNGHLELTLRDLREQLGAAMTTVQNLLPLVRKVHGAAADDVLAQLVTEGAKLNRRATPIFNQHDTAHSTDPSLEAAIRQHVVSPSEGMWAALSPRAMHTAAAANYNQGKE
eukprot:g1606.t1